MNIENNTIEFSQLSFFGLFKIIFWATLLPWAFIMLLWLPISILYPAKISMFGVKVGTTVEALKYFPMALVSVFLQAAFTGLLGAGLLGVFGRGLPLGKLN
ncbi:MAG: hypothetical protein COA84_00720 [Robiginitomaculum sp.]|nr:MAG: hypothetical protein COA84_00720 [Robiginitomaculum sp.]